MSLSYAQTCWVGKSRLSMLQYPNSFQQAPPPEVYGSGYGPSLCAEKSSPSSLLKRLQMAL